VITEVDVYPYTILDPSPVDNPDPVYPNYPANIEINTPVPIPPVNGWYHFTGRYLKSNDISAGLEMLGQFTAELM
jgi:hypothetical protein